MILAYSTYKRFPTYFCPYTHALFGGLSDLRGVHQQCVDDAVPPLAAAHCLDAAVVVSQREVGLGSVLHKLPLRTPAS